MNEQNPIEKLSFAELKSIAKKSGLKTIPRTYKKADLIKYITENSTEEKRKAWIKELNEKEVKVEERNNAVPKKDEKNESFSRKEYIVDLQKEKIHRIVVEAACEHFKEPLPKGTGVNFYDGMSDELLKHLHDVFVKKYDDPEGKNFELRSANWLVYRIKEVGAIRTRHTLPNTQELRLIGFDVEGLPYFIGEFSNTGMTDQNFRRGIENARKVLENYGPKLLKKYKSAWMRVYYFVPEEHSDNFLKIITSDKSIAGDGTIRVKRGFLKQDYFIKISAFKVNGNKYTEIHADKS
ncbi:MAG: hypothetical protein M1323_05615 [Candidatus Thermoplasmatota archaeon]|jgi:hypothetical protein|nr:hypothetical protein [Candidatus Thermoplasmatota archaeon]MCL6015086.1 hypothetical protein [Candidatus Thermoplasmatota archaeon]